jgi:hypothetical protein
MLSRLGRAKPDPTTRPRMHRWAGLAAGGVSAVAPQSREPGEPRDPGAGPR